jgi:phage baseplate assembly protein gpV
MEKSWRNQWQPVAMEKRAQTSRKMRPPVAGSKGVASTPESASLTARGNRTKGFDGSP